MSFEDDDGFVGDWADYALPECDMNDLESCYLMFFPRRDFWEDHFNIRVLQQILDLKFNTHSYSEYIAEKDHYQLKIRLKVFCKVCQCDLKGYDPFMSHNDGKAHKKMRQSNVMSKFDKKYGSLEFKSLAERRNYFKVGTLEHSIDSSTYPIVGVGFVFCKNVQDVQKFNCTLCRVDYLSQKKMFEHLQDPTHGLLYMSVKFQRQAEMDNLIAECQRVVEKEGRISNVILDFSDTKRAVCLSFPESLVTPDALESKHDEGCLAIVKKRTVDVGTQKDSNYHDAIAGFRNLHLVYTGQVAGDLHKWSLILNCLFFLEMKLARFYAATNNLQMLEHCMKVYHYLTWVYKYNMCVLPELEDDH